jgi:hypothetical protein
MRKPAARKPVSSVPARPQSTTSTPAPAAPASGGGMMSGIGSTIMSGMAFGTGSAIAHQAVGAAVGSMSGGGGGGAPEVESAPLEPQAQQQQLQGACVQDKQMFFECLQINRGDQQACSFLYDTLQTCQRNDNQMQFN